MRLVLPILVVLSLAACKTEAPKSTPPPAAATSQPAAQEKGTDPSTRDAADADGIVRRGKLSGEQPLTVAQVYARAAELDKKSVKVTGKVESVCKKKGCWFVIKEGEQAIRVTFKDYKYFAPNKSAGMTATLEGTLMVKTIDQATAQHYEEEKVMGTDEKPKQVTGPQKELMIAAVGVEMKN